MKKLITVTAIALLVVFSAGLANAKTTPVCSETACNESGTLHFVSVDGTTATPIQDVTLTLKQVAGTHFWTGQLVIPANTAGVPEGTINVSAIKAAYESDDPHLFYDIAGTDTTSGDVILQAAGENNAHAAGSSGLGFGIHGTIHSSSFVGSFHGPLTPVSE